MDNPSIEGLPIRHLFFRFPFALACADLSTENQMPVRKNTHVTSWQLRVIHSTFNRTLHGHPADINNTHESNENDTQLETVKQLNSVLN